MTGVSLLKGRLAKRRSECVHKATCRKEEAPRADVSISLGVQFLKETKAAGCPNANASQQMVSLPFAVAEVAGEILWQQSQTAEGVVPPVVKIHHRPSCGIQHPTH